MKLNKLISFVSIILILVLFIGAVSATEANSGDNTNTNEILAVEQNSAIDASSFQELNQNSEVLGAGDSEILRADEGTFKDLHELINGNKTINLTKDYKYDPTVDQKYPWNGVEDAQDYKYGVPIWDVRAGFNNVKTITINGNGHTIDGNHMARIFNASHLGQMTTSGVNLVINNVTFINGYVESDDSAVTRGGAIVVGPYKVTLTLNNCTFEDNMAYNTNMGDPIGNESNIGTSWGGAVYVNGISGTDYSVLYVNNCTFRNNTANYGGAIASASTNEVGRVIIKDSLFDDNHAVSHPYNYSNGIYYFNGKWYSHGWGGAVYAYYTEVRNSTFVNNRGGNNSGFGGAISSYNGRFMDSKFINNTCYQGGAIADGHMTHGTSGVDRGSSYYEIDNCTFDNNKAQLSGGAVLTRNLGAYFFGATGDMVVTNSNFTNNYGGVYGGGAIMSSCPFIYNSNFINNSAYNYGGAVTAGYAEIHNVTFVNNSAAHSGALFCIEPYIDENVTFDGNYIIPRVLYDNGFTTNDTEVQDGKVIVTSEWTIYVSPTTGKTYYLPSDWSAWNEYTETLPSMYQYEDSAAMNKGIGYYGFEYEVDLYGHAIEYDHKDVKGGYGQVSPGGAEGIVTDDLSYLINYIDGRELKEYIKILYYLCNLNETFMDGAFRNEEAGELALEFPIKELCFSDLSNPINDLMKNITELYDSGFRVPNNYYKLSDTLKDHMAHSNVMVPDNADDILNDDKTVVIYRPFLYIVPFYHTHYLCYYQTNLTIEKITLNKTVMLGEDVEFKVTVTNGGNYSVYDIFVQDYQYDTDGLIYKGYKNDTGHWVYDEETARYNLVDVVHYVYHDPLSTQTEEEDIVGALKPRTSKSIIFVFTTNKTGVLNNTATNGYSNATNNTTVLKPDLKIEKIALNKTVYLGNQTMFKLRITNIGDVDLSNILVEEYKYDDELILADFKADWPWFGNIDTKKFVYFDTLKPGESSEFIVIFNTTKVGNFTNYAVATHNKTGNRTANNTTEVIFMININKVWDDADNQDGVRPDNVTVELYADDVKIDEMTLSEDNNWTACFKELHGYDEEGNLINYTVKEVEIDKYTTVNPGMINAMNITVNDNSFEIKNNHTPEVTEINVTKIWEDANNQDGIRPDNVTVMLLADLVKINETTLSDKNKWAYTFNNLPVNKNGTKIVYTVVEVPVDGYTNVTVEDNGTFNITNTHIPDVTNVTVIKTWEDADDQDGLRPASVTVYLYADDDKVNETDLSDGNGWTYTFNNLPVNKNGTKIVYSVAEVAVDGYTNVTAEGNGTFNITNTHIPEVVNITVIKKWIDNDNYDEIRPSNVSVQLYANDVKVDEPVSLEAKDNWEYTFENLPKYENGTLINYTIKEAEVEGYNTTIENFTITNTHIRPNMTVEKITLNKTVLVGQETSFTIKVTNTGNCNLTDIKVVEEVPEGLRYDNKFEGENWYNNGNVFIYKGILNPGESISFNITFTAIKAGDWLNKVNATSNETENKTNNNTTKVVEPGLSVRKITLNESVLLGEQVGFVVVVSNTGNSTLTGVYVVDNDFTEGIVLDHMLPNADWTFDGIDKFTYGKPLEIGESANFTVIFNTTSIGSKINNVTAGSNETNETNSTNKTFVYNYNLTVRKISLNESVYLGTPVAFIVVVTNNGTNDLTGVYVIDDDYTEGIVLDHMVPNDDWTFDGVNKFTYNPEVLHVGESANFTIWFNTTIIGHKINNVTADSKETPEVNSTNKTHVYVGNMSVRKISLNESVYLGNQVGFIVVVTNTGDCDLPGVYVVDNDYTEGIVLDHMVPNDDWTFDGIDRFTYNPDVLPVGESANFTIWFNTTSVGDKINNVTAGNDLTPEVNSTNKTHVYVGNMTVRKISNNESVKVGEQVSFTIIVKNTGGCDLTGVYVVDNDYSSGLVYDHFVDSTNKWSYEGNGKWTFNDVLGIGQEAGFDVIFNTTSVGVKINNVTAGNNITNETVNSTNKTNVTNETVPPEEEVPPTPQAPPKHEIPPKAVEGHQTGNPLLALLMALIAAVFIPRRRKQ